MNKDDTIRIYERNQIKLIKALTKKIKENKRLKEKNEKLAALSLVYEIFLTPEQKASANVIADAMIKKNKEVMPDDPT